MPTFELVCPACGTLANGSAPTFDAPDMWCTSCGEELSLSPTDYASKEDANET